MTFWRIQPRLGASALGIAALLAVLGAPTASHADGPTPPPTLAEQLFQSYDAVGTLTCSARKKTQGIQESVTLLSRVTFQRPDHIHVENIEPARRRIIADGERLYYHVEGARLGFSKPIDELNDTWLASLRNVPGSPMDHLRKLRGVPEDRLPATSEFPVRAAYRTPSLTVVLSCSDSNRLSRIDFYRDSERTQKAAAYAYSQFVTVNDACAIPCLHKAIVYLEDGSTIEETHRFTNLTVNEPVSEHLFQSTLFFKDVEFVDNFEATLPSR